VLAKELSEVNSAVPKEWENKFKVYVAKCYNAHIEGWLLTLPSVNDTVVPCITPDSIRHS
jgi:hypothetical protein